MLGENLSSLKSAVNKKDIDKLKSVPTDLIKLKNVVHNGFAKTTYDKLVKKLLLLKVRSTKKFL